MVRIPVPGEKAIEPDHVGRARRADQDGARGAALKQRHPPKNERPHNALAEFGFGDQKRAQAFGRDQQSLDVALRRSVDEGRASGKLTDVGQELTDSLFHNRRRVAQTIALGERHRALKDDKHA